MAITPTRPRRVFPLEQTGDYLGEKAITTNPAPSPKPPATPKPKVAKPKAQGVDFSKIRINEPTTIDSSKLERTLASPNRTSNNLASQNAKLTKKLSIGELRQSESGLNAETSADLVRKAKNTINNTVYKFPEKEYSLAEKTKGVAVGLLEGLSGGGIDPLTGASTSAISHLQGKATPIEQEYGENSFFQTGKGIGKLPGNIAATTAGGLPGAFLYGAADRLVDNTDKQLRDKGNIDLVEATKEGVKGGVTNAAFAKLGQKLPIGDKISGIVGGKAAGKALGAAANFIGGGAENVALDPLVSLPVDAAFDIGESIGGNKNPTNLERNPYNVLSPEFSRDKALNQVKHNALLGGLLRSGTHAVAGEAPTGTPSEPLQRRNYINLFGDQAPQSGEQNIVSSEATPIFEAQAGESFSMPGRPSTPTRLTDVGKVGKAYAEPRERVIPLKPKSEPLQQPTITPRYDPNSTLVDSSPEIMAGKAKESYRNSQAGDNPLVDTISDTEPNAMLSRARKTYRNSVLGINDSFDPEAFASLSPAQQWQMVQEMAGDRPPSNPRNQQADSVNLEPLSDNLSRDDFIQEEMNRTGGILSEFPIDDSYAPSFEALRSRLKEKGYGDFPGDDQGLLDAYAEAIANPRRVPKPAQASDIQGQFPFMNEQASEGLPPRSVEGTSVAAKEAGEYAKPILNSAIEASRPTQEFRGGSIPGLDPSPLGENIANFLQNARGGRTDRDILRFTGRQEPPTQEFRGQEDIAGMFGYPKPTGIGEPKSFADQVGAGSPRVEPNPLTVAPTVAGQKPKGLPKTTPLSDEAISANRAGEALPNEKGFSVAQQGKPSFSPGAKPGVTSKPVAAAKSSIAEPDRGGLSIKGRQAVDKAKAEFEKANAELDYQVKNEQEYLVATKDRKTVESRLEQIRADRDKVKAAYQEKLAKIQESQGVKRVEPTSNSPKPKDIRREQDLADVAEQKSRKQFTDFATKEDTRLSTRVKDLEARVARNQEEQAKLKPSQKDRAKDLKDQADDLQEQLVFAKRQRDIVAHTSRVMQNYESLPDSLRSTVKANYDAAVKELADIAPKAKVVEGANVTFTNSEGLQQGKVIRTIGANASVERADGKVFNLPKKDLNAYHETPEAALPKEVGKIGELFNKSVEAKEAKKKSFAQAVKQIVSPGGKTGQAGVLNLQDVKKLVDSAKSMIGNIKGFNSTKVSEFLAGDKGVLESIASSINMARIGLPHQRFKDAFATASDQLHSNMLVNPVASLIDRIITPVVGGERSFTTGTARDYLSNAATLKDAAVGVARSQKALFGDKYVSAEAKALYDEYSLKGLFAKTTLTNPIARSLGEVDLAMKQGIRKRVTQNEIYLRALNDYAANKANISGTRKSYVANKVKEMSQNLAKYEAGHGLPKSDWEAIHEIKIRAEEKAIEGVFAQDNTLSTALESMFGTARRLTENKGKAAQNAVETGIFLSKVLMPFLKVKTNVARKAFLNLPPAALGHTVVAALSKDKAAFSQALARTTVNSALMAIGWQVAGAIAPMTRFGTKDPEERQTAALNEVAGRGSQDLIVSKLADPIREAIKSATGVNIPGVDASAKLTWAGGITSLIAFGAMMRQKAEADRIDKNDDRPLDIDEMLSGSRAAEATVQSMVMLAQEHPAFATVGRTLSGVTSPKDISRVGANLISDIPSGLPGLNPLLLAGRVASQNNPFDTSARAKEDPARDFRKGVLDNIQEELPGKLGGYGREALPQRIDNFGRPIERAPVPILNPFGVRRSNSTDPLISTMTDVQAGPSPIDRKKGEPLGDYLERKQVQGSGAYEGGYEFLENADPETRLELSQGLTQAMGKAKTLASKDKRIRIKSRDILKNVRKKQEKEGLR